MTTTNGNRPILDLKRWEFCSPAPAASVAGSFIASSRHHRQRQLYCVNATTHYLYMPEEDGWVQLPSGALAGTFAAGACGVGTAVGPSGTATAGTTTTITSNLNLARDLRGYSLFVTSGPNAGATIVISGNTIGANSVITVPAQGTAFSAATTFRLLTPRWYVLNAITAAGNTTAGVFKFYDFATNTWAAAETGTTDGVAPAAVIGTDGKLISTPSWVDLGYVAFATGAVASGTTTTLTVSGPAWATNQWANSQVRITGGAGAGQIRTIASNTGNVLTVSAAFSPAPDNTSTFSIEGNDDFIYYTGSNATTFYRYSISAGTWTTLAARPTAPGAGMSGHWIYEVDDPLWNVQNAILNGRYIYSFRGANTATLERYDIAANAWATLTYAPAAELINTGAKHIYRKNFLYTQQLNTGRWLVFNIVTSGQNGWNTMTYTQGAAIVGDTAFDCHYRDGATEIDFAYILLNTSTVLLRCMIIND